MRFRVGDRVIVHPTDDWLAEKFEGTAGIVQSIVDGGPLHGALYVLLDVADGDDHLLGVGPDCAELVA